MVGETNSKDTSCATCLVPYSLAPSQRDRFDSHRKSFLFECVPWYCVCQGKCHFDRATRNVTMICTTSSNGPSQLSIFFGTPEINNFCFSGWWFLFFLKWLSSLYTIFGVWPLLLMQQFSNQCPSCILHSPFPAFQLRVVQSYSTYHYIS